MTIRPRVPLELGTLALLGLAALALLLFALLTDAVRGGEVGAFDRDVLLALRDPEDPSDPLGPPWFETMVRDFSALGSVGFLTLVTLSAVGFLVLAGRKGAAVLLAVAVGSGQLLSESAKVLVGRPRPDLVPHEVVVYSRSFPSGHAMVSAVTWLTLAALVGRSVASRRLRVYLVLLAALLAGLAGASRVYLGVHWPTDVLAGWAAGSAWAILCWLAARRLERRGAVEAPPRGASSTSGGRSPA